MKIYYILEVLFIINQRNEFQGVMSWSPNGSKTHIKNVKLL